MAAGPPPGDGNSAKRKRPQQQPAPPRKRYRPSIHEARAIASQTTGKAFGDGEVQVEKFVKAHEFEIRALEDGMRRAKKSLSTRAFQNVPRDLRRRTASHNVKRVPKRLRARAHKEMVEDNTPTVTARKRKPTPHMRLRLEVAKQSKHQHAKKDPGKKSKASPTSKGNDASSTLEAPAASASSTKTGLVQAREPRVKKDTLQKPSRPKARFRKRQIHKTWLPTHLFHAKRAHMTPPKEPLWRMAIPLSPTAKSYRPMHRASSARGAIAWDISYMSTIALEGPELSVAGLLKALGVGGDEGPGFWGRKALRWLNGTRSWDGWVYERDGWPRKSIAPVTIIWCARESSLSLNENTSVAQTNKGRKDRRRALIRVHPSAFLQVWQELLRLSKVQKPGVTVEDIRFEIGSIELVGPASTEALVGVLRPCTTGGAASDTGNQPEDVWDMLGAVNNPANLPANALLGFDVSDPRLRLSQERKASQSDQADSLRLLQTLSAWPVDKSQPASRLFDRTARLAACRQLPSQKAINRRKTLAEPGQQPKAMATDPNIPVVLLASRTQSGRQGSWTLLLPWKCVLPVWYALMYYPLSTGGIIRFGGLNQKRQIGFEMGTPWFPADHPGTKAGIEWEVQEREKRKKEWESRPKGRRVEFDSLKLGSDKKGEVGLGWSCDWEEIVKKSTDSRAETTELYRLPTSVVERHLKALAAEVDNADHGGALITVQLTLLSRGVPTACARIYRLPTTDTELHKKWISLVYPQKDRQLAPLPSIPKDAPSHVQQRHVAASILNTAEITSAYPEVPGEQDLMGFITTGNFNLGEGKGTGLGCILLNKVLEQKRLGTSSKVGEFEASTRLCIVREAGQAMGRLARWELV